jgi:DNA-binding CsgD family transcriptional regulator
MRHRRTTPKDGVSGPAARDLIYRDGHHPEVIILGVRVEPDGVPAADEQVEALVRSLIKLVRRRTKANPGDEVLLDIDIDDVRFRLEITNPVDIDDVARSRLSPREAEVARMVAHGYPNKAIAAVLEISSFTVASYLRRIFAKLGVNSRAAMVALAIENNLLSTAGTRPRAERSNSRCECGRAGSVLADPQAAATAAEGRAS